ncbi:MAG: hypothetical protein ACFCBW_09320, partial [Candidatus Competibacterales bacterium]
TTGSVTLRAVATDNDGASAETTRTVTVQAPFIPPPAGGSELIVDNEDSAFTTTGSWPTFSTASNYASNYQIHNPQNSNNPNTATWRLAAVTPGRYEVQAYWVVSGSRSPEAPYTVYHASGNTTVTVDQRSNGGSWQTLGTFDLDANSRVVLSAVPSGKVAADAIRVVPAP